MNSRLRHLLLLTAVVCLMQTATAEAGYLSLSDGAEFTNETVTSSSSASSSFLVDYNSSDLPANTLLERLLHIDREIGFSASHGGMSNGSSSSTGGSSAPAAILGSAMLPTPTLISPLYLREIPHHPRLMLADIFRPPCA